MLDLLWDLRGRTPPELQRNYNHADSSTQPNLGKTMRIDKWAELHGVVANRDRRDSET